MLGTNNVLTTMRVATFYNATKNAMATSLSRIASGKNFNRPQDDVSYFMRLQNVRQNRRGYERIESELDNVGAMMDLAESSGTLIVDNINEMKRLSLEYWGSEDATTKTAIKNQFDALKDTIADIVDSANYFGGKKLMQDGDLASVILSPSDMSNKLTISFDAGDVVDATQLDVTGISLGSPDEATVTAAMDVQYDKAMSYVTKVSSYIHRIEAQKSVAQSVIDNSTAYESTINDVDDAKELSRVTENDIRQQAALSMLAQANNSRFGILKLLG